MTLSEENYLKAIYHLSASAPDGVATNAIARVIATKASSVTDMLKKLADKNLLTHVKYQGVVLTTAGKSAAKMIVRKHRLWEVFLVDKLGFAWDEVHDIAEQLEHIKSEQLINKLDAFLGHPTEDPHGDPIPNAAGEIHKSDKRLLSELAVNESAICVGVNDTSSDFLKYLDKLQISIGSNVQIVEKEAFDASLLVSVNGKQISISNKTAGNLYVKPL